MSWLGHARSAEYSDILLVCTGNVCRSPYIAAALRSALPELVITSAGTRALSGEPPTDLILRALDDRGIPSGDLGAGRALTRSMVRGARLIVTATRLQRIHVVGLHRGAMGRAFTLKELARVIDPASTERGVDAVVQCAAATAHVTDATDFDDDLDDPFGLEWPAHEWMAAEVDAALAVLVPALTGGAGAA
jgi:protein-tyrosine phosphatase